MANGFKSGGRLKGTKNKVTAERQAAVEASGLTPLEFMLSVMRDPANETAVRLDAAKAAAGYVHPRLTAVSPPQEDAVSFVINAEPISRDEWLERYGHRDTIEAIVPTKISGNGA